MVAADVVYVLLMSCLFAVLCMFYVGVIVFVCICCVFCRFMIVLSLFCVDTCEVRPDQLVPDKRVGVGASLQTYVCDQLDVFSEMPIYIRLNKAK